MSNFFESASNDLGGLQEKTMGPSYSYSDHIRTPQQLSMSGSGSKIASNIHGLQAYVELLFQGGGKASKVGGPLGRQMFVKTGANCKDKKTGEQVTRSIYINNIPVENSRLSSGMSLIFGRAQGLIPGILNNIESINPMGIFGAFMQGSNPDCMAVTLPTRNNKNIKKKETAYLTKNDIRQLSPCLFDNRINPLTKKGAKCIDGFSNYEENIEDLDIFDFLFPERNNTDIFKSSDIIAYIYFISLIFLFFSLIK